MLSRSLGVALAATLILPALLPGQLVTNLQAIPRTGNPPVIFLNGFSLDCGSATFVRDFGIADQVLQANGRVSIWFNNCTVPGNPSIEVIGNAFAKFLASLKYDDGQPVRTVDAVAYSMGGLVLRSYLSGKQEAPYTFTPPASFPIRKALFVATPHFGSAVASLTFGADVQATELSSGSHFLMDLNTWNQNRDDLRGIEAMALAGTGGTGRAVTAGFDDGLVALSSASLHFYMAGRTRVLPLCHSANGIASQLGFCASDAQGIIKIVSATDDNARILVSFLAGTTDWQSIGGTIEQNSFLKNGTGVIVRARTAADQAILPSTITATPTAGGAKRLNMDNSEIGWTDLLNAGGVYFGISAGGQSFTGLVDLPAGGAEAVVVKPGPSIKLVAPAAAVIAPLVVVPRMLIAIYGTNLDQAAVSINGTPLTVLYSSAQQINAVLPAQLDAGLVKLLVQNAAGLQTFNLYVEPVFPAIFVSGQPGGKMAAALNAITGSVVSATNPLRAGDYLEIFLTGLGGTVNKGSLDYATVQPTVTLGGVDCPVTFAGAAPGFMGLDQINCRVPAGLGVQTASPLIVTSGVRSSPVATVAVQ
jgi:uncharacterized protein (TIGR03437 family)